MKSLYYVFDPLCGWCYGFSPVVSQLIDATKKRAEWTVLSGGMVTGPRIGPIGRISDFLKSALPRVEGTTGIRFGDSFLQGILEKGKMVLSSVEPSRALTAVKTIDPASGVPYAQRLQTALYRDGRNITEMGVLSDLAEEFGVVGFEIEYLKTSTLDATLEEFELVTSWGITGFPTLVGDDGSQKLVLARGYLPFERLIPIVDRWLDQEITSPPFNPHLP